MNSAQAEPFKPQLRAGVAFGPPLWNNGRRVYYVKDAVTQWFYRIGEKEHFLLSRMDGSRTLPEIEAEYSQAFHRRLQPASWLQIFALLHKRHLLDGDDDTLAELKRKALVQREAERRIFHKQRLVLFSPDQMLTRMLPWLSFVYTPAFVGSALLAILAFEAFVIAQAPSLFTEVKHDIAGYSSIFFIVSIVLLAWIFTLAHEFAHGLTCKYFGGSVSEIGLMRNGIYFLPYCKIDDALLFHNRWHRVFTALAGVFVNMLMLLPFAFLWWLSSNKNGLLSSLASTHRVFLQFIQMLCAFMLLFFQVKILLNLAPFFNADGNLALSYMLDRISIHKDAQLFWSQLLGIKRRSKDTFDEQKGDRKFYILYGISCIIFVIALSVLIASLCFILVRAWLGPVSAWYLLPVIIVWLAASNPIASAGIQKLLSTRKEQPTGKATRPASASEKEQNDHTYENATSNV